MECGLRPSLESPSIATPSVRIPVNRESVEPESGGGPHLPAVGGVLACNLAVAGGGGGGSGRVNGSGWLGSGRDDEPAAWAVRRCARGERNACVEGPAEYCVSSPCMPQ